MPDELEQAAERFLNLTNRLRNLGPSGPPFDNVQVTPPQLALLDWVAKSPGCGVREIAEGLGLTPPTISVAVRRLEKAGFLERQPDRRDGRAIQLFLTPEGQALRQRMQGFRLRKFRSLLVSLNPQERTTLLDLLERAIRAAENPE